MLQALEQGFSCFSPAISTPSARQFQELFTGAPMSCWVGQNKWPLTPLKSGTEVLVGLSVGIAIYPDDAEELEDLFSLADADMYRHKGKRITD